ENGKTDAAGDMLSWKGDLPLDTRGEHWFNGICDFLIQGRHQPWGV
ncbi:MAG: hypothetical protein ACI9D0_002056, partial [Bacteroidia bacterium]